MCQGKSAWQNACAGQNQYQFNGIERNEDLGLNWDLATFRSYDAAIGRWMQIDPRAEKYYGMTPYNGMGNNPILFSDMNGDSLWVTAETVENADGTYTNYQTIRGTVKVLDVTGKVEDLNSLAGRFKTALNRSLKGKDQSIVVRSAITVQAVESMDEVADSDHLMVIVGDVVPDGLFSSTIGKALMKGKIAYTEYSDEMVGTMVHEFGHNMGLEHNWEDDFSDSNSDRNYMSYGSSRNSFSNSQVVNIKRNMVDLNRGSNHSIVPASTNHWWWFHTSSNRKPYYFNVNKGDRIPRPIN